MEYNQAVPSQAHAKRPKGQLPIKEIRELSRRVENCGEGQAAFASFAQLALSSSELIVAVDAEWWDPRPVSLLQLAISTDLQRPPTVFLVDVVNGPSDETKIWCRRLLSAESHLVMAFSCHEDKRRLRQAGLLCDGAEELQWLDLQRRFGHAGSPPSLQSVVARALGLWMDKQLQTSDWDARPLSVEQKSYAALDASVLLRLYGYKPSSVFWEQGTVRFQASKAIDDFAEGATDRWDRYRAEPVRKRQRAFTGAARDLNADLCFLLLGCC